MQVLVINVSGYLFEVSELCLKRFPDTLLGNLELRNKYFCPKERVYFFDRHRLAFEGILMFYQTYGRVACPENVPLEVFATELRFFHIRCDLLDSIEEARLYIEEEQNFVEAQTIRQKIWNIFKHPGSTKFSKCVSAISLLVTCVSIILVCASGMGEEEDKGWMDNVAFPYEVPCFIYFTLEYLLRLWACPNKKKFLTNWIDSIDLFILLVFYNSIAFASLNKTSTAIFRVFRLSNALRLCRLTRFSYGLRLLIYTLYKSKEDMQILAAFLLFFMITSGSMIYYAGEQFEGGILDGLWFSIISCTTVGYGDIVPKTLGGKLMTSLTITLGAMLVRLPVLKLVQSFSDALDETRLYKKQEEHLTELAKKKKNVFPI